MSKLIKNGQCQDNPWQIVDTDTLASTTLNEGHWLIPAEAWLSNPTTYTASNIGIWLASDFDADKLTKNMAKLPAIAIVFSAFADGRGFSLARILREDCDYTGELQAAGGYMQDQLFFLYRCGFNAYCINEGADIESMKESLSDFSNSYQAAVDESRPLFRRR